MSYRWVKELESGNTTIDARHKEMFDAFNTLFDACARGKGKAELLRTLEFLCEYADKHLVEEEQLMLKHDYPDYAVHRAQHSILRRQITAVIEDYRQSDISRSIVAKVNSIMSSWLVEHVLVWDVRLAAYLRTQT